MLCPNWGFRACLCLAARWAIHKALDRLYTRLWPGEADHVPVQTHSMPVECVAYILLYHSLWFTLFVFFAGFPEGAAMVLGFNWLTFLIAAARVSAATSADPCTPRASGLSVAWSPFLARFSAPCRVI